VCSRLGVGVFLVVVVVGVVGEVDVGWKTVPLQLPYGLVVFISKVTALVKANSQPPFTTVPVVAIMDIEARIFPVNIVPLLSVAADLICEYILHP
jgi:hypothetical protein